MSGKKTAPLQSTNTVEFLNTMANMFVVITTHKLIVKPLEVHGIGPELFGLDCVPILDSASNSKDNMAEAKIAMVVQ